MCIRDSWKAAFKNILSQETLDKCANFNRSITMYRKLLDEKQGNGYILEDVLKAGYSTIMLWVDVYKRQEYAHVLSLTLVPKDLSHTFHQFHVKAGCRGAGCRKADCIHTFIQAEMICRAFLFAQAVRAVCHHNGRNP